MFFCVLGMFVYFLYGYYNSIEGNKFKFIELELDLIFLIFIIEISVNFFLKRFEWLYYD